MFSNLIQPLMRKVLTPGLRGRLMMMGEILSWQAGSKILSIFAFAHAAKCLGPEKFGVSGIVLSVAWELAAIGSIMNEAFLSRRYRRARSQRVREALVHVATGARLVLALVVGIPAVMLGFSMAPNSNWWLALFMGIPFLVSVFLQPNWLLTGQDASNVIWRAAGVGSLVCSALLFLLRPSFAPSGIDVAALTIGAAVTMAIGWRVALEKGGHVFRLSFRHFRYALIIIQHSRWLFLTYWCGTIYLFSDTFLLGIMGSALDAGIYRPASNLTAAFYQAACFLPVLLYPKFLDLADRPEVLWNWQIKIAAGLAVMSVLGIIVAFTLAEPFFRWTYGVQYIESAGPFLVLLMARTITLITTIFSWGLIANNRDRSVGLIFLAGAGVMLGVTTLLISRHGIWAPAFGGLAADVTIFIAVLVVSWRLQNQRSLAG